MPLFDYECNRCDRRFEELTGPDEQVVCPGCGGTDVARQLGAFAVGGGRADPPPAGPCGGCDHPGGPGACRFD